jgi:RNA polymerase sigma-70 factor (ECF subfamily)
MSEPAPERWRPYLLLLARAHAGARHDPSDIVQEALLAAHKQRGQFRGTTDGEYVGWLRRILAGRLADAGRAMHRVKRDANRVRSLDAALAESSARLMAALAADQTSPSEAAVHHENLLRLANALADLPAAQRDAITLRHCRGWSIDQIATHLDRTPAAVAGLLKRGLKQLRVNMNPPDSES